MGSSKQRIKSNRTVITCIKYINHISVLLLAIQVLINLWRSIKVTIDVILPIMKYPDYPEEVTQNSSIVQQLKYELSQNSSVAQEQEHELPWFGWQPRIPTDPDCSWTQCFKNNHGCNTTCRDEDLDDAPLPIKPVPPPKATKGDSEKYWIPDITMLHRMRMNGKDADGNVWPPPLPEELCEPNVTVFNRMMKDRKEVEAINDPYGHTNFDKLLFDLVPIKVIDNDGLLPPQHAGPRILCLIYTMEVKHSTRIRAIRETWASRCDGFLAFSTKSDPRIPAISIQHVGREHYNNMWQKVRAIWRFVGTYYNTQFDYYMIGGDDLFVIPENMRNYLSNYHNNPTTNHYFIGRRFRDFGGTYFNTGGPGYILSQATLNSFVSVLDHPKCLPNRRTSAEDVMISKCLYDVLNISFVDTRDEQGRERFHHFSPAQHFQWKPPKQKFPKDGFDWYEHYNRDWGIKLGVECCAPDSVAFHSISTPAMLRHLYSLLYTCKKENVTKDI